jgi:hypothetical protein
LGNAIVFTFQLMTMDAWFKIQHDVARIVTPALVVIFFIAWIWLGSFIFRNVFIGVMGMDSPHSKTVCPLTYLDSETLSRSRR